jgi:hypothetical protein
MQQLRDSTLVTERAETVLLESSPMRLIYIAENGQAMHAELWETHRNELLGIVDGLTTVPAQLVNDPWGYSEPVSIAHKWPDDWKGIVVVGRCVHLIRLDPHEIDLLQTTFERWQDLAKGEVQHNIHYAPCGLDFKDVSRTQFRRKMEEKIVEDNQDGFAAIELLKQRPSWMQLFALGMHKESASVKLENYFFRFLRERNWGLLHSTQQCAFIIPDFFFVPL